MTKQIVIRPSNGTDPLNVLADRILIENPDWFDIDGLIELERGSSILLGAGDRKVLSINLKCPENFSKQQFQAIEESIDKLSESGLDIEIEIQKL